METTPIRLGDVLQIERIPVDINPENKYIQIGIRSFGRGIFHRDPVPGKELGKLRYFEVHPGRLIVSNIMAWEGAVALSSNSDAGCVGSNRFLSYAPTGGVDLAYLNYFFQGEIGRRLISRTSTGTVVRNQTLSIADFEDLVVPFPDLSEQRRLAVKLDRAYASIVRIEKLRAQACALRNALRVSLITPASLDSRTRLDCVESVLQLVRTPISIDSERKYRPIGLRSFGRGIIRYPETKGADLSKLRFFRFPTNALAFSNIKAWEGAVGITSTTDSDLIASNRFLFYVPRDGRANISYLRHYFLTSDGLAKISACSPGSADRNRTLNAKAFERIVIPLPPPDLQRHVASVIDRTLDAQEMWPTDVLDAARPSLLNAAFSGSI